MGIIRGENPAARAGHCAVHTVFHLMHFDLVDLRLIVNIAGSSSLTRGAERSSLSLPAASVRIKNLEKRLGSQLLYRTSQGVTLTPPGHAFAHHARLVLNQLEHLRGDLQEYAQGVKGHLRVFASTTAITEFLPAVLRAYLSSHPDVNVDLREQMSSDIVRAVGDYKIDIGIVSGNVQTEDLEVLPYRKDKLVLVVPTGHALAQRMAVPFVETLVHDYVGMHEVSPIHTFLNQMAGQHHRGIKLRIQVGNFEATCRMIEAGVGIGVLPAAAALRHAQNMDIRIVQLEDEWATRHLHICMRSLNELPLFARDLVDLLLEDAATSGEG